MSVEEVDLMLMVKTYPQPSKKYQNLVCSAGITEDGRWLRLYPIRFEQFIGDFGINKRDVIRLEIEKNRSDKRKESYKVNEVLKVLSKGKDTRSEKVHDWIKKVVLDPTVEGLISRYHDDFTSLGIIRPRSISDLVSEKPVSEEDIQIVSTILMGLYMIAWVFIGIFAWGPISEWLNQGIEEDIVRYSVITFGFLIFPYILFTVGSGLKTVFIGTGRPMVIFISSAIVNLLIYVPLGLIVKYEVFEVSYREFLIITNFVFILDFILIVFFLWKFGYKKLGVDPDVHPLEDGPAG